MKTNWLCILITIGATLLSCKQAATTDKAAIVSRVIGTVEVVRSGETRRVSADETLMQGDVIRTGELSLVLLQLPGGAKAELQSNSELALSALSGPKRSLNLQKGSNWLAVDRLSRDESFEMVTPTTIAGVRGTKFYTFHVGDITGTCHCEGDVQFQVKGSGYDATHHQDSLVVSRAGKTALITPADIKEAVGVVDVDHQHSQMEDSPLGKKNNLTPEQMRKMMELMQRKLN